MPLLTHSLLHTHPPYPPLHPSLTAALIKSVSGIYWKLPIIPVDSKMKPGRSNYPSDTMHHGTVIIEYVRGISKKLRCFGNPFNVMTIFKSKHTLCRTSIKSGLVKRSPADEAMHVQYFMQLRQMLCWGNKQTFSTHLGAQIQRDRRSA
jgi:hypothetical protein